MNPWLAASFAIAALSVCPAMGVEFSDVNGFRWSRSASDPRANNPDQCHYQFPTFL